jgi:alkylmercury lyase
VAETPNIDELAALLVAAMPKLDESEQHIALTLIRQLAVGAPVSVEQLATAADAPLARVTQALERLPGVFRDEQQRIIGFMGLSVPEMGDHRIHLDGRTLSAWCAWDTLFLPELIGATARVGSRCPEAAGKWTVEHPGTFTLSVEDAYQLGRLTNRAAWGLAMAIGARR